MPRRKTVDKPPSTCLPDQPIALCELCKATGCMVFVLRDNLSIAFCCSLAQTISGQPIDTITDDSFLDLFVLPAEKGKAKRAFRRVLTTSHRSHIFDLEIRCRGGTPHSLTWTTRRLDDFEGSPAVLAVGKDVSVQSAAQNAIREGDARLQAILDAAVDGIVTTDDRGFIESVNPTTEDIFGYSTAEMVGQNVQMLMPKPYSDEHDQYIASYLKTGEKKIIGFGREVEGLRKDGTTFPMDLAVSEVQIGDRRLFTGVIRDITERNRTQEQLLQSERLAAIGQMVAGLAHESRNAFQRSQASLELLAMEVEDQPEAVKLVRQTQRAQDHIYHLYEEVRHFAAPINLRLEPIDLSHIWRRTWSHLAVGRDGKDVSLEERCTAVGLTCHVDSESLEQVFRNIMENAIDACPEPGKIVVTCTDAKLDRRPAVSVSIRDNGPGLDQEARERIFEPFFTTKTKGTGLGMAIARRIVEAHGGRIAVQNGSTRGAAIKLTLPRQPG